MDVNYRDQIGTGKALHFCKGIGNIFQIPESPTHSHMKKYITNEARGSQGPRFMLLWERLCWEAFNTGWERRFVSGRSDNVDDGLGKEVDFGLWFFATNSDKDLWRIEEGQCFFGARIIVTFNNLLDHQSVFVQAIVCNYIIVE